jgi:uncharacterized protein YbjT (DUF2867 family)
MKVFVTGASGLLGRAVYQQLKKNGHEGKVDSAMLLVG